MIKTYFVINAARTRVKIGRTRDIETRLHTFQYFDETLVLLLAMDGDHERELHHRFAKYRLNGEWFRWCDDIGRFIAEQRGEHWRQPFYSWLLDQRELPYENEPGKLAFLILKDRRYPWQSNRLEVLVRYLDNSPRWKQQRWRKVLIEAHRQWREEVSRQWREARKRTA